MKKLLILWLSILFNLAVFGQNCYCDISTLSPTDKVLLNKFWSDFKTSINSKNKLNLSSLINFPFNCDYCIEDTAEDKNYYIKVTKKKFDVDQYKIFFDEKLIMMMNKNDNLLDILSVSYENKKCHYNFSYASVEPSKNWEGQQRFFTLQKINKIFLITSTWTVP